MIERFERQFVVQALERHQGSISRTADEMGMYRQHLRLEPGRVRVDPERCHERP